MPGHKKQKRTTKKKAPTKKHKQGTKSKAGKSRKHVAKKLTLKEKCAKKKLNYKRPGPAASATCFPVGTVKRGNKGGLWKIESSGKSQRWVKQ